MSELRQSHALGRVIRSSPIIWMLGLSAAAYQLAAAWPMITGRVKLRAVSKLQALIAFYCAIYFFSICLASIDGAEVNRLLAALYNLSIWVAGALVFTTVRSTDSAYLRRSARIVLVALFVMSVGAYAVFSDAGSVKLKSVLGYVLGGIALPENLAANTNLNITSADWSTLGIGSRLSVMAPYPTALGMLALSLCGLASPEWRDRRSIVSFIPYVLFALIISYLCASRAAMGSVLLFGAALACFCVGRMNSSRYFKAFLFSAGAVGAIAVALLLGDIVLSAWESINATRADSSSLRFELYTLSVKSAWESAPLLGFGVKERIEGYAIPLGSHSTLFGSMYKTGFLGFSVMIALLAYICIKCIKVGFSRQSFYRAGLAAACLAMVPLLVFEDIDAIPLVALLFFSSLALMERDDHLATPTQHGS